MRAADSSDPVRVIVADDHASYRHALDAVLSAHGGLTVVGEAPDGRGALELILQLHPHVALVDVMMAPVGGFEVCRSLRASSARAATGVILISAYEDPELVKTGRAAGAAGYLSKEASNERLCAAVLEVARGGTYFDAR
jgi:DNA-binding NarL/FixJ family response regulator